MQSAPPTGRAIRRVSRAICHAWRFSAPMDDRGFRHFEARLLVLGVLVTEQHASLRQAPAATGPALDSTRRRGSRRPGSVAVAVAVVLLLLGVLGSVLAGAGVARSDA